MEKTETAGKSNFKIGVTTGLYSVARSEELATSIRKVGFGLTRGASAIEISGDVPHEITETEGTEIRHMAKKQGIELLFHGSLTVPMCMPERGEWRDAHDHMQKSVRSAIYSGCKYTLFHACLNIWLELMTYAGRKLTMVFCDHEGRFIANILKENAKLRKWFVENRWEEYLHDALSREEITKAQARGDSEAESWLRDAQDRRLREAGIPEEIIQYYQTHRTIPHQIPDSMINKIRKVLDDVSTEFSVIRSDKDRQYVKQAIEDKLAKGGRWHSEELRVMLGVLDGYHIMAHHLFYTRDSVFTEMANMYKNILDKYDFDYNNDNWVDEAWKKAEDKNDREFKEFFYAAVAAKFLEGHIKALLKWMDGDLMKELKSEDLKKIAKDMRITIELPDARDATHAGLHLLWRPRQLYAAIKAIRKNLKTDRIWMTADFEHVATQGLDPIKEMEETIKFIPDFGENVLSVHSNAPNPMHAHEPLDLGDVRIYRLLWYLRKTGLARKNKSYIIYERGGGEDPFKQSIAVLRLAVKYLEKDVHYDELPEEYFGLKGPVAGDFHRQEQIVRDHAFEPMKDLLEIPEEEWTMLSQAVVKKGKRPEQWKKGEFR